MSHPLVSVIIVCYNHNEFIGECLDSIFNQTYPGIELLVIDNSDNDKSMKIVEPLLSLHNFKYIKQENIGLPLTLNKYIPEIKGAYCILMSADDYMLPDRIEKQLQFMESNVEYAMSYGKSIYVDECSKVIGNSDTKKFKSGFIFDDLIRFKFHPPAPTYMFRSNIFEKVGLYDTNIKYIEDRYMNIKIAEKFQIGFLDESLTYHRQHRNNLTSTASMELQIKDCYYILKHYSSLKNYKSILNDVNLNLFCSLSGTTIKYGFRLMWVALPRFYTKVFLKSTYRLMKNVLRIKRS